jgi:hypothetical protein
MHPMKELHYFDTLHNVRSPDVLKKFSANQLEREIRKICDSKQFGFINRRYKNYLRTAMLGVTKEMADLQYKDLFRPCLAGNELLGEITPEYMLLPQEGVKHMADVIGNDATIILLARNPAERLISAFKLYKIGLGDGALKYFEDDLRAAIVEKGSWMAQQDAFNEYQTAFNKYKAVFENVLLLRYEDVFENPESVIQQLKLASGIEIDESVYRQIILDKVNNLADTAPVSIELKAELNLRYSRQNDFLENYFGSPCSK